MTSSVPGSREGDWECDGCGNKNYAFRSFCNRCKQPRLLVDSRTPSDSKWLPRIGDWICAGCSNNNYASRDKCNKCGILKEVSALPAMTLPGAAMAAPAFAPNALVHSRGLGSGMDTGMLHHIHPSWPYSGTPLATSSSTDNSWRAGDWLCNCGFHNYSSRIMCKKCSALMPMGILASSQPTLPPGVSLSGSTLPLLQASALSQGLKRPAANDLKNDLKRLHMDAEYVAHFPSQSSGLNALSGLLGSSFTLPELATMSSLPPPSWNSQPSAHTPSLPLVPTIVGKGAKQWRSGDWMCAGCNNHNYASRVTCNRCSGKRESAVSQVLSFAFA